MNTQVEPKIVHTPLLASDLLRRAFEAAQKATNEFIEKHPSHWFPCGFAWVNIKPARGPVVRALKAMPDQPGYTDTYYGGYTVYNPSKNPTQSMDAKEAGARAFAEVLKAEGVKCSVGTRWD